MCLALEHLFKLRASADVGPQRVFDKCDVCILHLTLAYVNFDSSILYTPYTMFFHLSALSVFLVIAFSTCFLCLAPNSRHTHNGMADLDNPRSLSLLPSTPLPSCRPFPPRHDRQPAIPLYTIRILLFRRPGGSGYEQRKL